MEIDIAEIPPLAGFTSKERDTETGLDYFGARYYDQRFAAANSWRVEDPALSGRQWPSVDPMAGAPAVVNSHARNTSLVNRTRNG